MLEGFERYDVTIGLASVSITENGISFSKTAVVRMGKCSYVVFYIDYNNKRIAIQKADKTDQGAIKFYNGQKIITVRWNNKGLLKTISDMMNWKLEKGAVYRCEGDYSAADQALIFNLQNAVKQ